MATIITDDCINCAACEPECPNTAIYQGDIEYEQDGAKHAALSADFFYIVGDKCTECVGFFDEEACAVVCPVDCCIPDPERPESEQLLIERARVLHPGTEFAEGFPSRFSGGGGGDSAAGDAASADSESADGATVAPVQVAAPVQAAPVTSSGRVEKVVRPGNTVVASGNAGERSEAELGLGYRQVVDMAEEPLGGVTSTLRGLGALLLAPLLGALGHGPKAAIEAAVGNRAFFNVQTSTALNVAHNFILYPFLAMGVGLALGARPFTEDDNGWIFIGVVIALLESTARLRQGLRGTPVAEMNMGASLYGFPLGLLVQPLLERLTETGSSGAVPVEGFYGGEFEEKRERQRRYGDVYTVEDLPRGYRIRLELPRVIPPSATRDELGIGDEMPDYDLSVSVQGDSITVKGSVVDEKLRAICGVSSSCPADFHTRISLDQPLGGYRQSYADKLLEIVVLKQVT